MKMNINEIDLEYESQSIPMNARQQVALLLGAGFSVPAGLPTANILNEKMKCLSETFPNIEGDILNTDLCVKDNNNVRKLLFEIITLYSREYEKFDYEEFYDFLHSDRVRVGLYAEVAYKYATNFKTLGDNLCYIIGAYINLINHFLTISYNLSAYDVFEDFLSYVAKKCIVNVHTLNHDMLFEYLIKDANLQLEFSDGFSELGSHYYGIYKNKEANIEYHCRLEQFTNNYREKAIRLYKLHGSLNYVLHSKRGTGIVLNPDSCLKIPNGIGYDTILEEIEGKDDYEIFPFADHPYFLSGTRTKCKMYKDSLIWGRLQDNFKQNLKMANCLIIIGYGCKDKVINESIKNFFDYESKKIYLIDPNPSESVSLFAKEIMAEVIKKGGSEIEFTQFKL